MKEVEEIKLKFGRVYQNRPSTIRSSVFYGPIGWVCRIVGWLFLLAGIGLFIATIMGAYLFELPNSDGKISNINEAYQRVVLIIQTVVGAACFLIGLVLAFIGNLCRKILVRNMYILELEGIFEQENK